MSPDAILSGKLGALEIVEIVKLLCQSRQTGELVVRSGARSARLTLREGGVVAAWLSGAAPLGRRLIEEGVIDIACLDDALALQARGAPFQHLGALLVERGWVQREQLEAVVETQVRQTLFAIMSWRAGSFAFTAGDVDFTDDAVYVPMRHTETHQLLVEVVRGQNALKQFVDT